MAASIPRRAFLKQSVAAGLGLGLFPARGLTALADPPRIQRKVRLGRTGLEIADVAFGSSRLRDEPALVEHALARGINYFDTAEGYTGGQAEETLGAVLKGHRNEVILTSKVVADAAGRRADFMRALEGSLKRLRTDRVEVYFNHAVNDRARLENPEWAEFLARAKKDGKIRFSGMSGHGGRLVECIDYALDHDLADVLLVAYNFGQDPAFYERMTKGLDFIATQPDLPRVLAKAKQKDVGVVAMKTLMGGKLNDLRRYETDGATYAQAAFRWVLSDPHVDALIVSMTSTKLIDEYLGASGWATPRLGDRALLERYVAANGTTQCRYGCTSCASSCPAGVPIADVLRLRMYADDYGDLELARDGYAALGAGALACASCSGAPCAGACPHGVAIHGLTRGLHSRLAG